MLLPFPLLPLLVNRTKESGVDGVGDGGDVMGVLNDEELLDDELSRLLFPPPPLTLGDESGVAGRIGIGIEVGSEVSSDGSRDGVETATSGCCCCDEEAAAAAIAAASAPVVVVLLL